LYQTQGFEHITIQTEEEGTTYIFKINEGQRISIDTIQFHKVSAFDPEELIKKCFQGLLKLPAFEQTTLDRCLQKLQNLYHENGHLYMKVERFQIVCAQGHKTGIVHVVVDEGPQICISDIVIKAQHLMQEPSWLQVLREQIKQKSHKLALSSLNEWQQHVADIYKKHGYMQVKVTYDVIHNEEKQNYTLLFTVTYDEKKHYFGKTVIAGTSRVPISLIERAISWQQGDIWNYESIKETFNSLKETNLFDRIVITPLQMPWQTYERLMLIKVHEDDPCQIRTRLGFELQHVQRYHTLAGLTYKVGGSLLYKSPAHLGDMLRFDADVTRLHREIILKYSMPLARYGSWCMQLYSIKHEQPGYIGNNKNIYDALQNGILCGFRGEWGGITSETNLGFELIKTTISKASVSQRAFRRELARAINFEPQLLGQYIPYFFVEPTLLIKYIDNALNPSSGFLTILSIKGMFPVQSKLNANYFIRCMLEQIVYVPIEPLVVALRFRCGHIFHKDFSAITPIERFYLGGSHSLRSYDTDLVPPLGEYIDENGACHLVPRGARSLLNVNLELRFPLYHQLGGVVFQDAGVLSADGFAGIKPDQIVGGTGFGLRYATPLGPLRFDIGWKWNTRKKLERSYAWFLTFGQSF
jgi:outer membrane protein assembly factor BamA